MRFYLFGPRFLGIRPGISFNANDFHYRGPTSRGASYIYVIKGDRDNVKIGVTKYPETRLAQIQTGLSQKIDYAFIAPTSGNAYAIEKEAHAMLARHRLNGEWFDASPELAIAAVAGAAAKLGQSLTATVSAEKPDVIGSAVLEIIKFVIAIPLALVAAFSFWIVYLIVINAGTNSSTMP
jgi:Meiotically up-regulated gene 113